MAGDPPRSAGTMTTSSSSTGGRSEVATVYAIGLFQGLSLVAFPAAATILTAPSGYNLSKSQYGLLFLPQVVMAIAGSLALPTLTRRFRLKRVLLAGLVADAVAMGLLVGSEAVNHDGVAYRCSWWPRPRRARLRAHPGRHQHLRGRLHARSARTWH